MGTPEPRIDNRTYYDTFAARYEERRHGGYHLLVDDLESDLVQPYARGKHTLEVGCGTGLILDRITRVADRALGVDLSAGMIGKAKQKGLDVHLGSATALPFADERFDVTYSFKVLAHVEDLPRALSEMARVTKRGGRVFAELYNKHSARYLIRRLRGGHAVAPGVHDDQVYVRFDSPADMQRALPSDLELVKVHGVRVVVTMPQMVGWPLVGAALKRAEWSLRSSPLGRFGGFLVLECVKR